MAVKERRWTLKLQQLVFHCESTLSYFSVRRDTFERLEAKYGRYSSWAIWNRDDPGDTTVIGRNLNTLKASVVLVALNISGPISGNGQNFHGGPHDRKLMYAFNYSLYRGAYMTDILKGEIEPNSARLLARIKSGDIDMKLHIEHFRAEMEDVGANENSLFILFGRKVAELFDRYLPSIYANRVRLTHYSMYGSGYSDAEWLAKCWKLLQAPTPADIKPAVEPRGSA